MKENPSWMMGPDTEGQERNLHAFPNAYLETDEPATGLPWPRIFVLVGAIATAWFGVTILVLSLFDVEFNPITQAASDYGVGSYAPEMNVGFLIGGIGLIAFSLASIYGIGSGRSRVAAALFLVAGGVLILDSYFTTNIEGGPSTFHGLVHGFGGFIFFITAPAGTLLIARKAGRAILLAVLVSLLVGFVLLAANINASGLAERIILGVIFISVISRSVKMFGST